MTKKFFSVIIVPHSKTNTRTLTFSKRAVKFLIGGAGVVVLVLGVFLADYFSMTFMRTKYRTLVQENSEQKERIAETKNTVKRLETTVANYEDYARKLNIMMGLKSADVIPGEPGLGGGDPGEGGEPQAATPPSLSLGSIESLVLKAESVEKNLGSLVGMLESQVARLASTPTIWPTQGWVSSPFGYRIDPYTGRRTFHRGIDIATNFGNPVAAAADGSVTEATDDKFYGNTVIISHGNGVVTQYCHLEKYVVKPGQKIRRGDILGYVGKTGKALGPHLHYEVRINDTAVNPYNYILEE
jgi:murein DD-endopeptidase MepM/ murein hydrolase activator NlpD